MFNVPIIICTNDWSSSNVNIDWELWYWIQENSVHVKIDDFLYNKPAEEES